MSKLNTCLEAMAFNGGINVYIHAACSRMDCGVGNLEQKISTNQSEDFNLSKDWSFIDILDVYFLCIGSGEIILRSSWYNSIGNNTQFVGWGSF